MLRSLKSLLGFKVEAKDGEIGKVVDFFFDDERWIVRYLVDETGNWLTGKKVLISPAAFVDKPAWEKKTFPVILTRDLVKDCPDVDFDKPISRQKEAQILAHYKWPMYWQVYPESSMLTPVAPAVYTRTDEKREKESDENHIRSVKEIMGYTIHAADGDMGEAEDFIIDDETWRILYAVADVNKWLPGKKVLLSLSWIDSISWEESHLKTNLTREEVKESPSFDPNEPVNRKYEERLYDYYGRPKYWLKK